MRRAAAALGVVGIVACAAAAHGGYFLADDFTQLALLGDWDRQGALARELVARLVGSSDEANAFYRPLTLATFVANYLANGASAPAWLAVNLLLHGANAALVALLVLQVTGSRSRAAVAAAVLAGVVFFAFSPSWEVALWVASRYDALATFFTLAAGLAFLRGRRGWALCAGAAALLAKESGAVAIVLVAWLALADAFTRTDLARTRERAAAALRSLLPWIVLGALYTALRLALFGSAARVYGSAPADLASASQWRALGESLAAWAHAVFPGYGGAAAMLAASLAIVGTGVVLACTRDRRACAYLLALSAACLAAIALLLPHVRRFEASGIGGRLFYQAAAFYAAALGVAVHEAALASARRPLLARGALALAVPLVAAHFAWGTHAAATYRLAQRGMRTLVAELPRVAHEGGAEDFVVVIVPDVIGRVPFGAYAPAGMVLPPVQREPLSHRVLVWSDQAIGVLDRAIDGGLLAALRERPLLALDQGGRRDWPRLAPSRVYCWNAPRHVLVRLAVDGERAGTLSAQVARAYAAHCVSG